MLNNLHLLNKDREIKRVKMNETDWERERERAIKREREREKERESEIKGIQEEKEGELERVCIGIA